jgi:hypothetical protein
MEQIDYNMLFRWFIALNLDDEVWDPTVFTKAPRTIRYPMGVNRLFCADRVP